MVKDTLQSRWEEAEEEEVEVELPEEEVEEELAGLCDGQEEL